MSGPKVIRVVTRAELVAICAELIAQVEAAFQEWESIARRNEVLKVDDCPRQAEEISRLKQAVAENRFKDVQGHAPAVIDRWRRDLSIRVEAKYAAEAESHRRDNSLRLSATQLYERLGREGVALPPDIETYLSSAAAGRTVATTDLRRAVASALQLLPEDGNKAKPSEVSLLKELRGSAAAQTLDAWLASDCLERNTLDFRALDHVLSQLATCDDPTAMEQIERGAEDASRTIEPDRRRLLIDSLVVEASGVLRQSKARQEWRHKLADERASASAAGDGAGSADLFFELENHIRTNNFAAATETFDRIRKLRAEAARTRAVAASRHELLRGLKELGYAVNENMALAWAKNNRLVVSRPNSRGIAVELGAFNDRNQFQARVVSAQSTVTDLAEGKTAEVAWCNDVAALQDSMRIAGGSLQIDLATPPGTKPLKKIAIEQDLAEELLTDRERFLG